MVLINLFPSRNRGTDMESGFVDTGWEGEGGTNWDVELTYIHYHV